jgi:hypothetical protein
MLVQREILLHLDFSCSVLPKGGTASLTSAGIIGQLLP